MELETLIAAAHGDAPADLLLKDARLVNVLTGEIHAADIAIYGGRIVGLGRYEAREVVDALGAEMLGNVADTLFAFAEKFDDRQTNRMGHRLNDLDFEI